MKNTKRTNKLTSKLTIGIIAAIAVALLVGLWMLWSNNVWMMRERLAGYGVPGPGQDTNQPVAKGTLYMAVTDAAVNMGNVSAVNMTVDKIYLHSQAQGWVTVSQESQTFNLLALKAAKKAILATKIDVQPDSYDQVWLHVTGVKVTESGRVKEAVLPSSDVKMDIYLKVLANATSTATIDVVADESLHKTAKGEMIFAPVLTFESRSNSSAAVDAENFITISGGTVDSNASAGMDVTGEVKNNFKLAIDVELEINAGAIQVKEKAAE